MGQTPLPTAAEIMTWTIADHLDARRKGVPATHVITVVIDEFAGVDDRAILIGLPFKTQALEVARLLDAQSIDDFPLHGIPFVVKDNIDVADTPTTCGCPSYAYIAEQDAEIVARLRAAGAIPVGKANLDQFATGLVGTRSPYGTPRNPIDPLLVPGGSSAGSAVAVARGLVPFALGTDTAGSGRVPAAMCEIVGLKPTVGRFPSRGMVPAVRRIDCPTVFARTVADARVVAGVAAGFDPSDAYSRRPAYAGFAVHRIGVPRDRGRLAELMEPEALRAYEQSVAEAAKHWPIIEVDLEPFLLAGQLLYGGSYVAERTAAVGEFIARGSEDLDPTVAAIINGGNAHTAIQAYRTEYRLAEFRTQTAPTWETVDALLLPTIPGVASLADVAADPIGANARLGTFTTFANLLDLACIAIPTPRRDDGRPFGVQFLGPAWTDEALADAAETLLGQAPVDSDFQTRDGERTIVVVGAHLRGMPLNHQLTSRGARFLGSTTTAPTYELFALDGTVPPKPGLRRAANGGTAIEVELWALCTAAFGSFVCEIPPPLGIGSVELANGSWHKGFICEPQGFDQAANITSFAGWRAYRASVTP
jgi:allophanate hydrolase